MMKVSAYSLLWLSMLGMTLASYSIARAGFDGHYFVGFILLTAFIKGQFIIDFFMKLKWAGLLWRSLATVWLLLVLTIIAWLYWIRG